MTVETFLSDLISQIVALFVDGIVASILAALGFAA